MSDRLNRKPSWSEISAGRKTAILAVGIAQIAIAAIAWRDLAARPADEINGRKGIWAAVIAIDWIGPIAYFVKGRRNSA